jgi:hypothetical protein
MLIIEDFPKDTQDLLFEPVYRTTIKKVIYKKKKNRKLITFNISGYGKNLDLIFSAPLAYPIVTQKEYQVFCFADKKQMYSFGQNKQKMFEYLCELSKEVKKDGRESRKKR